MPRGGKRQGNVGTAYPNRSDLQSGEPVAVKTSPGQVYGTQVAQRAAQKVVPIASPPGAQPQTVGSPAAAAHPPVVQVPSPQGPMPGSLDWTGPSNRPTEPLTHGLAVGPGAGPTVMTGIGAIANRAQPQDTATKLLATLALQPTAGSQLRDIARTAMTGG